ncbi:MAG TPA: ABC transporter permease [Candidatus Polarisedimenticolia bacterium]|nr:ABC transporter permease [Candidatus Polarisedimenticolia bacterium]
MTAWVLPVLREARDGLTRHPALTALATLSMAVSLYVLGMFLLIAWNVRLTTTALGRELQMQVYMRPGADAEAIETIRQGLRSDDAVAEARLVTADEARRRFAERFPRLAGLSEGLGPDLFPTSFEVVLRESHRGPEEAERLAKAYRVGPGVDEIRFDRGWFERLTALFDLFRSGGYGVGALLVLAVMVTVGAIVRLTVLARREEIEIMKLVGATAAFIRAPFLMGASAQGLVGGLLALGMLRLSWELLVRSEPYRENAMLALAAGRFPPASLMLLLPALGMLLAAAAAALSLRRASA